MLNLKERAKGRKTKSKIMPDKTIKIEKQTSDIMSEKKDKKSGPGQRDKLKKFQKIKQKRANRVSEKNPFVSTSKSEDLYKQKQSKSKVKSIVPNIT